MQLALILSPPDHAQFAEDWTFGFVSGDFYNFNDFIAMFSFETTIWLSDFKAVYFNLIHLDIFISHFYLAIINHLQIFFFFFHYSVSWDFQFLWLRKCRRNGFYVTNDIETIDSFPLLPFIKFHLSLLYTLRKPPISFLWVFRFSCFLIKTLFEVYYWKYSIEIEFNRKMGFAALWHEYPLQLFGCTIFCMMFCC